MKVPIMPIEILNKRFIESIHKLDECNYLSNKTVKILDVMLIKKTKDQGFRCPIENRLDPTYALISFALFPSNSLLAFREIKISNKSRTQHTLDFLPNQTFSLSLPLSVSLFSTMTTS